MGLKALRYNDPTYSKVNPAEVFLNPSDIGIRWALPGGIQKIELVIKAKNKQDAAWRYNNHLGHRIALYDHYRDRPICGQVFEIIPDGRFIRYICHGPIKQFNNDLYLVGDMSDLDPTSGGDSTDTAVKDILDDRVTIANSDQTNIDASSVDIGAWSPNVKTGTLAGDCIKQLALIGADDGSPIDFYIVDAPFDGTSLQNPIVYFKKRSLTASADWVFSRSDMARGGISFSRNIWKLKRVIKIGYNKVTGSQTGATGALLIDSAADFITAGVSPGDVVYNLTQSDEWRVDAVDSATQLSFAPVSHGGNWVASDNYLVKLKETAYTSAATSTETDLWTTNYVEIRREMDQTQAAEYRDQIKTLFEKPMMHQSFVVSSKNARTGGGQLWPLWRLITGGGGYVRINDLFLDSLSLSNSDDRNQTFFISAMDYQLSTNRLRIVPSTNDARLDALLNQAKITGGQMVSTASPPPPDGKEHGGHGDFNHHGGGIAPPPHGSHI